MATKSLDGLSVDELILEQQKNSAERAKYDQQFAERGREIQARIDKQEVQEKLRIQMLGLDEDTRRAVLAGLANDKEA